MKRAIPWLLVTTGLLFIGWYLAAQTPTRVDGPFRVLVQQTVPPVTLFEHRPSGTCFVAHQPGGLVVVDSGVCQKSGGPLPIGPPGPPVSPEK